MPAAEQSFKGTKNMTMSEATHAIRQLQTNADGFFDRMHSVHSHSMKCKVGCSQCCYVDLSVFEAEAAVILEWVDGLEGEAKAELKAQLERETVPSALGFDGKKHSPCAFLVGGACVVYGSRPTVCRTQGAALQIKKQSAQGQEERHVDACPLNFQEAGAFPPQDTWLDLNRLNALLSLAERSFQSSKKKNEFEFIKDKNGRVPLLRLKKLILETLLTDK